MANGLPSKTNVKDSFEEALEIGLTRQFSNLEDEYLTKAAAFLDLLNQQDGLTATLKRADFVEANKIEKSSVPLRLRVNFKYESEKKTQHFINEPIAFETNIEFAIGHLNGRVYASHCYWTSDKEVDKKARFFFDDLASFEPLLSSVKETLMKKDAIERMAIKRAVFDKLSPETKGKLRPDLQGSSKTVPLKSTVTLK